MDIEPGDNPSDWELHGNFMVTFYVPYSWVAAYLKNILYAFKLDLLNSFEGKNSFELSTTYKGI